MRVWTHRRGRGTPLLLVHGLGADHRDWLPVAERLRGRAVLLCDLAGHGRARADALPASIGEAARRLWSALDDAGCAQVHLAGHSLGGAVVQEMLVQQTARVPSAVVSNSLPSFRPSSWRQRLEYAQRIVLAGLLGPAVTAWLGAWRMFPDDAAMRRMIIERGRRNGRRAYLHWLRLLSRWSRREALADAGTPIRWLIGGQDYLPAATVRAALAGLPNVQIREFADGRHGLPLQYPDAVAREIAEWVGGRRTQAARSRAGGRPAA